MEFNHLAVSTLVAASVVKACAESGEPLAVQRKALELATKWLKLR